VYLSSSFLALNPHAHTTPAQLFSTGFAITRTIIDPAVMRRILYATAAYLLTSIVVHMLVVDDESIEDVNELDSGAAASSLKRQMIILAWTVMFFTGVYMWGFCFRMLRQERLLLVYPTASSWLTAHIGEPASPAAAHAPEQIEMATIPHYAEANARNSDGDVDDSAPTVVIAPPSYAQVLSDRSAPIAAVTAAIVSPPPKYSRGASTEGSQESLAQPGAPSSATSASASDTAFPAADAAPRFDPPREGPPPRPDAFRVQFHATVDPSAGSVVGRASVDRDEDWIAPPPDGTPEQAHHREAVGGDGFESNPPRFAGDDDVAPLILHGGKQLAMTSSSVVDALSFNRRRTRFWESVWDERAPVTHC
jgi:hypothetical protein